MTKPTVKILLTSVYGVIAALVLAYNFILHGNVDSFKAGPIRVVCRENTEEYCPSREQFEAFLEQVSCPFNEFVDSDEAWRGVRFTLVSDLMRNPTRPDECDHTEDLYVVINGTRHHCYNYGMTFPGESSYVVANRAMDLGTGGHELRLHLMHYMFVNQPELYDIEWMRDNIVECR